MDRLDKYDILNFIIVIIGWILSIAIPILIIRFVLLNGSEIWDVIIAGISDVSQAIKG